MARRPVEVRTAKWAARMYGESLSPVMARRLADATAKYSVAAEEAYALESSVVSLLNAQPNGVAVYAVPYYMTVARQMAAKQKRFSGESLAVECEIIKDLWVTRGLTSAVIVAIRTMLGIAEPIAP